MLLRDKSPIGIFIAHLNKENAHQDYPMINRACRKMFGFNQPEYKADDDMNK
jgi:hypothetical protein